MERMERKVIITNIRRGLCYGVITATDEEICETRCVRAEQCRHIAYWHGPTGGITSLAISGPDGQSRIGAPTSMLITDVANVLDVSAEAADRFDAVTP